jgi:hypothetical protein
MGDGLMRSTHKAIRRQQRLARDLPAPAASPNAEQAATQPAGSVSIRHCKITKIDRIKQRMQVRQIKPGIDPSDPNEWMDNDNFEPPFDCVWTRGPSIASIGNSVTVTVDPHSGTVWAIPSLKFVDDFLNSICLISGFATAPALPVLCDEPVPPGICGTQYACCLPDGSCQMLTEQDCLDQNGIYHEGKDCDDQSVNCELLLPCCLPPFGANGACVLATFEDCKGLGGIPVLGDGCTCENANCENFTCG